MNRRPEKGDPQSLTFLLDGKVVRIAAPQPTTTVLDYLRNELGRCGTKEGCAEGDCGACTVVIGELEADKGAIRYKAVNSCIRFLPTLDGKELITVESLAEPRGELHPVQRAMVDCHASQCGFCTPGFVMSLFALYQSGGTPGRDVVVDALAGNLCRCTGYRPIIDAGIAMHDQPDPQRWGLRDAQSPDRQARLAALARVGPDSASLCYPGFHAPRSLDELAQAYAARPQSQLLAGGTDVGLWVTQQLRTLAPVIFLGEVAELRRIHRVGNRLWIGASVTLDRAWTAIVDIYPELAEQAARFASPPIRNSATLCGNLANGSPIGDGLPAMLALDARLILRSGDRTRSLALDEFYLGYQKKALEPGEFIVAVEIPTDYSDQRIASYKVAKRHDQDISAVSVTFRVSVQHGQVIEARLAYGGMAATARRARAAEAALVGQPWNQTSIAAAQSALATDFTPMSDMRATQDYRLQVAGNLLQRFFLQGGAAATALPSRPVTAGAG